ncbi:type II toxin-antitoxin system Phd/YefM family antitoxin [Candidatus Paracaedibacter symbiosus]|uniref:type II toxin-antitoxin system Phd/YefM family antitoxin n=1 Tax=Candidatus Paracaedibacter symbiosus TaxID=244582 RepID=UPI0018DB4ECE|nr:type II toxin-antitoxin system prevent-host-death family antitoxin [Candidatus Paracaedibacter symbiosus]
MDLSYMTHVSAFEAKTHLSQLLTQVQQGHRITITKHNTPVAILIPADVPKQATQEIIDSLLETRKKHTLSGLPVTELKEEGRR